MPLLCVKGMPARQTDACVEVPIPAALRSTVRCAGRGPFGHAAERFHRTRRLRRPSAAGRASRGERPPRPTCAFDLGAAQPQNAPVRGSQSPESPGGSSGGDVAGVTTQEMPSSPAAAPAEGSHPAGQRGSSDASQQLQALAHHLMDEVSQVIGGSIW